MMSKHVPSPKSAVRSPRRLDRRSVLLAGLVTAGTATVSACTSDGSSVTELFSSAPQPDEQLVNFYWALKDAAEAASVQKKNFSAPAKTYLQQAEVLSKEISRQCGRDNQGNAPQECTSATNTPPAGTVKATSDEQLRQRALRLITSTAGSENGREQESNRTVAGLATGIYSALASAGDSAELEKAQRLDAATVAQGFGTATGALRNAIDMTYGAIYVSGVALAADGGQNRETLRAVADRLRDFREAALGVVEKAGEEKPVPHASYRLPDGDFRDSAAAVKGQLHATQPLTRQLRFLVTQTDQAEAREFAARWCGLMGRLESALERAQGRNPLAQAARGE